MTGGEYQIDDRATHCPTLVKHVLQNWIKRLRQGRKPRNRRLFLCESKWRRSD
jgi:hypothetical protein